MSKKSSLPSAIAISFLVLIVISAWVAALTLAIKAMLLAIAVSVFFTTLSYARQRWKERKDSQSSGPAQCDTQ